VEKAVGVGVVPNRVGEEKSREGSRHRCLLVTWAERPVQFPSSVCVVGPMGRGRDHNNCVGDGSDTAWRAGTRYNEVGLAP
jgi:hypothetical protein